MGQPSAATLLREGLCAGQAFYSDCAPAPLPVCRMLMWGGQQQDSVPHSTTDHPLHTTQGRQGLRPYPWLVGGKLGLAVAAEGVVVGVALSQLIPSQPAIRPPTHLPAHQGAPLPPA